jgi:YebC/PmpR family DNA-binding regulatory protein
MAGHSKFKNIMHRKGAQDKKRGKIFTRLIREIIVACKEGGADVDSNPRLRGAITAAKKENMPKDKIDHAIKRGSGEVGGEDYSEIRYEGYGPAGIAIIVDALTDNKNRAASDIRSSFTKYGGNLGETGSVSFMFNRVGQITYPASVADEEAMFEAALEAGADNCETSEEEHVITCEPEQLNTVRDGLVAQFEDPTEAKLAWIPQTTTDVSEDQARTLLKLIEVLEESDDVQEVTANFEISDEIMEKLSA